MQKIKCLLESILSISLASVILVLILSPRNIVIGANSEQKAVNVPYIEKTIKTPYNAPQPQETAISPEDVQAYVIKQAKIAGVNEIDVKWIVGHESQFGRRMVGDDGISLGVWQFNIKANPEISQRCAMDLICSTRLALNWIKNGKIMKWTTWKYRCKWYQDAPDCEMY